MLRISLLINYILYVYLFKKKILYMYIIFLHIYNMILIITYILLVIIKQHLRKKYKLYIETKNIMYKFL